MYHYDLLLRGGCMEIQILGYILIPIGILLLFVDIKYLLYILIFFSGFTGSSIVNFGKSFSLIPSYYLGILFIIKYLLVIFKKKTIKKPNLLLSFFIVLSVLSIIMPNFVEGVSVLHPGSEIYSNTVEFNSENVQQIIHLIFCFFIYWFIKDYCKYNKDKTFKLIKVLCISAIIICLLGIYQEFAYIKGLKFDEIFRSAVGTNVQPFGDFVRVYSVTPEPSMLAYFLAPMLALIMFTNRQILRNRFVVPLIISVGIISTSTTFILGFLALIFKIIIDKLILLIQKSKYKPYKIRRILVAVLFAMLIFAVAIRINDNVRFMLTSQIYDKLTINNNMSGLIRSEAFKNHISVALKYPILGIGLGSARSKDLLSTLLCNVGFITTIIFLVYLFKIITKLKYTNKLGYGMSNCIFVLFICAFASVPELYYLFIWILFAIGESLINQNIKDNIDKKYIEQKSYNKLLHR